MPALKKNDQFVVAITDKLTDLKLKVLNFLYSPIMGTGAVQLYTTMIACVGFGQFESDTYNHQKIFQMMDLKTPQEFLQMRESLEALGLLDVYYRDGVYLYLLKEPLHPYDFFCNAQLVHLLTVKIGKSEFDRLLSDFLTYKYNVNNFTKVTKKFDEVFGIVPLSSENTFANWWASATNNGIVLKDRHFDFNHLDILLRARDLLDEAVITSDAFYQEMNRLSFMYGFDESDLADIVLRSTDQYHNINYEDLKTQAKWFYDRKDKPVTIQKVAGKTVNESNEIIKKLEMLSPNEVIKAKYGTDLTSGEIEMFEELRQKTGFPYGVINVLLIYLTEEKNGEIPNLNYFLRVANSWKRAKILTTEDAYNHISRPATTPERKPAYGKKEKPVTDWYQDYINEINQKTKENKEKNSEKTIDELLKDFEEKK
jgi:replication initiation and membrane attachment protein